VPDTHDVLFLQGGASQQFAMVPMNFLPADGSADYVITGGWSEKAHIRRPSSASARCAKVAGTRTEQAKLHARSRQAELTLDPNANVRPHHHQQHHLRHAVPLPSRRSGGVPLIADMSSGHHVAAPSTSRSSP
jgi:phosphoserine aminotransferase